TNFYTIRSNRLYYAIVRLQNKIHTLQSMLHSKDLETHFFDTCKQISELVEDMDDLQQVSRNEVTLILEGEFAALL
ncbi:MAG: hypothetical protein ACXAB4_07185, partial [Candidatus Hodarchaeales archaeon]